LFKIAFPVPAGLAISAEPVFRLTELIISKDERMQE